ncbi:hypothetical protein SODALDRAFT_279019 [Sodiomyces alkalinus F11]|uniref:ferric-chelate reductase (NADPH) n=1 Tax=Sodiomyces alkalinus (strain CBS 110278 / VKM F-3762 / F11) TaxID=1314773 RepID=A0A3N2PUS3_SODAK|nr:hypothetical protein SODALDRAFT_279019 [Sodiomyces alkalinus F11]ROT38230.1 hypothetical protein SODALDRAFT_279019 [Sodiomyces alkalinus F11]
MTTAGGLQATNKHLARSYWYLIAGAVGLAVIIRAINHLEHRARLRRCAAQSVAHPTKPSNSLSQLWATATACARETCHLHVYIPVKGLRWATPPPLGRVLLLLAYWAVVIYMSAGHDAVQNDVFFRERIGFRNGWTTIMQLPLLFLLAMKVNPVGLLVGTSHERLNWFHRWVARTMFITATLHGFHFWTQWTEADIFDWQMRILPSTKQGIGAWAVLLWTIVTGFRPLRHMAYELFVIQHLASLAVFLWLVYVHIPIVARPYLWAAIACIAFDRLARWGLMAWQNLRAKPDSSGCRRKQRLGHQVQVRAVGPCTTVLTLKDVPFSWKPGQHLYLWLPSVAPFEAHPYTVACATRLPGTCTCHSVQLVVRKHGGFSRRLHAHASKLEAQGHATETLTAFIIGPFGAPPRWDVYETLVLISASTGASFTLPILEAAVQADPRSSCVRRIQFVLTAAQGEEVDFYLHRLRHAIAQAHARGLEITAHVAVTRSESRVIEGGAGRSSSDLNAPPSGNEKEDPKPSAQVRTARPSSPGSGFLREYTARPDIESLIRGPVEASGGETSVIVCGGQSLTSSVRNCVLRLADERAVHKGTGAQGIHLFVEEYSF